MSLSIRVAVIGAGYVGLTTGACLATLGHEVICADIDARKIDLLNRGEVPILEDGLSQSVQSGLASGQLKFTLGSVNAVKDCGVVFICVPTPQSEDGSADLSYLMNAVAEIKDHLTPGAVVVNKSTVPVGTAQRVTEVIGRSDIGVVSNPEFLREGTAVFDFLNPDRIIIGSDNPNAADVVGHLYDKIDAPKMFVDTRSAELIKYASNAYLTAKISFANAISNISEHVGANAHDVLAGMGSDHRIGPNFLKPGPGWGGSCFPKDTEALIALAEASGSQFNLLKAVIGANAQQINRMVSIIKGMLGGRLEGARIAIWGLTYKAETDDTRESPALRIASLLVEAGAIVLAYDPGAKGKFKGIARTQGALAATTGADILVVLTEWPEFADIAPEAVSKGLATPRVLDTRNIINTQAYADAGFEVYSVGIGTIAATKRPTSAKKI
jgi:UDPglucose 6-dehydrogenase